MIASSLVVMIGGSSDGTDDGGGGGVVKNGHCQMLREYVFLKPKEKFTNIFFSSNECKRF